MCLFTAVCIIFVMIVQTEPPLCLVTRGLTLSSGGAKQVTVSIIIAKLCVYESCIICGKGWAYERPSGNAGGRAVATGVTTAIYPRHSCNAIVAGMTRRPIKRNDVVIVTHEVEMANYPVKPKYPGRTVLLFYYIPCIQGVSGNLSKFE